MTQTLDQCIIVNPDRSVFVMRDSPSYPDARDLLLCCAELEKSPGHVQVYKLTAISLWNAAAAKKKSVDILAELQRLSKFPIPAAIISFVGETMSRWGAVCLVKEQSMYVLEIKLPALLPSLVRDLELGKYFTRELSTGRYIIDEEHRGQLKLDMIAKGLPVEDLAGYCDGDQLPLNQQTAKRYSLRDYQSEAVNCFLQANSLSGGSGVIVLPCGAGKTVVGVEVIQRLAMKTLILVANVDAAKQWKQELLDKCCISPELIGEYHGQSKVIAPITIATYQILSKRNSTTHNFEHLSIANNQNWGLIIYDEVHMLPAELFKITSQLQARRRLGLTATLVREDRKEPHVFSLIGPKRYDLPWKILEQQGWIAKARCVEIRVKLSLTEQALHDAAPPNKRFKISAENFNKLEVVRRLVEQHKADKILVIGTFVGHIRTIAEALGWKVIDGSVAQKKRDIIFDSFKRGTITGLVVSKVANSSIDLPDASVIIQVSGQFGSRQEEAQRLGRALRPKSGQNQAHFYSIVSSDSTEEDFAFNRQLFLIEQGYNYEVIIADSGIAEERPASTTVVAESHSQLVDRLGQAVQTSCDEIVWDSKLVH